MVGKYYAAGTCNLNDEEVAFRTQAGYAFMCIAVALLVSLIAFSAHPLFGFTLVVPLSIGVLQFMQVRNRFCATLGIRGYTSAGPKRGHLIRVSDEVSRRLDKSKSLGMMAQAAGIALGISLFAYITLSLITN